jgi:alpha-glucoside transport system permease protein
VARSPPLGVLSRSFRPEQLADTPGGGRRWPIRSGTREWTLENYSSALDAGGFENAFLNSLAVTIPSTVIPSRSPPSRLRVLLDGVPRALRAVRAVVGLLVVPLQMALIPILRLYTDGRLGNGADHPRPRPERHASSGCGWPTPAFGLPLAVYLLRNYIGSLPSSIIESAKIDGADHFTIFWRLVVPLSVPALAAFAIFQFLWVWNDLLVAYVFLGARGTRGPDRRAAEAARARAARTGTC